MKISRQEVEHIAQLARLEMGGEEIDSLQVHMNDILGYMEQLGQVDTAGVEPTSHAIEAVNAFREDVARSWLSQAEALDNAPEDDGQAIIVPKVI